MRLRRSARPWEIPMKIIEHRRHTMRTQPGQDLSQAGVDLARRVGMGLGKFDYVLTSTIPRAFQTAIAMGYAVDEQSEELGSLPPPFLDEVAWDAGFGRFAEVAMAIPDGATAAFARRLESLHRDIARRLPESGRALIVSHGGFPEATAVGISATVDCSGWGPACAYCEGVQLHLDGDVFVHAIPLRVDRL